MDLVSFEVYVNKDLTLTITTDRQSADRAFRDQTYLQEITSQELNKLNLQAANKINSLTQTICGTNETMNAIHTICESNENEEPDEQSSLCEERNISLWSPNDTRLLLTIYKEKENNLKTGRLRQGQFWEIIAKEINRINPKIQKTALQCSNKIACLKRTYKNIKDHNNKSGNNRKKWSFYEDMNDIFGSRAWVAPKYLASEAGSKLVQCSSSSTSTSSPTTTRVPKRKREVLLEELINETKIHYEEKKIREEKKLQMLDEFREEKLKMHKEKLSMQQQLLDAITKAHLTNKQ
ncbi:PREDICTED: uncharacterized protein LOC105449725 [Wasmannia auropunctata]|uniref:uncharacterized protein LOC105449725 n=1 Tax=Wasmannia auropunctata TaxID=64793 RepID=UPI0005EFEB0C|nr:PREDICTED: uncharacterized protein LOC105449725 [Wasmannia auropunctata]XP_011687409.1 PREDICTED: uncharacterized protein LOC105449725 [Wasmannia auropunctata]